MLLWHIFMQCLWCCLQGIYLIPSNVCKNMSYPTYITPLFWHCGSFPMCKICQALALVIWKSYQMTDNNLEEKWQRLGISNFLASKVFCQFTHRWGEAHRSMFLNASSFQDALELWVHKFQDNMDKALEFQTCLQASSLGKTRTNRFQLVYFYSFHLRKTHKASKTRTISW